MATGRRRGYRQKAADAICLRIAEGASLVTICGDPEMPSYSTVLRWLADPENARFRLQYARAREDQADFYADQIIEIADREDNAQTAKLRIEARKWKAARLRPRVYGDRVLQQHGGDMVLTVVTGVPRADD